MTLEEYNDLQPWQLFALFKGFCDEKIDRMHHTRLILSALTGKDPRYLIELPGDWDDYPIMGETQNIEKMLKRAGLKSWLN